ncbi:hypothetical protein T484DRAFT_1955892, partial [Baffinella frigidus]
LRPAAGNLLPAAVPPFLFFRARPHVSTAPRVEGSRPSPVRSWRYPFPGAPPSAALRIPASVSSSTARPCRTSTRSTHRGRASLSIAR